MSESGSPSAGHHNDDDSTLPPLPGWVGQADHDLGGGYLFVRDEVIVHAADLGRFRRAIESFRLDPAEPVTTSAEGLLRYPILGPQAREDLQLVPRLVTRLRGLDPEPGSGPIRVWPHHVLAGASHARGVTVGPPIPAGALGDLGTGENTPGTGVTVAVLDTGLIDPAPGWLGNGVAVLNGPQDLEIVQFDGGRRLPSHAGHGTFVAGLVRQHAPGARILVGKVLDERGLTTDEQLAKALGELAGADVQVVNLSIGGYTHGGAGLPLTEAVVESLRVSRPDLVIVASAGNDGLDQPFYPAALKGVIGVAALDRDCLRACFSNYGSWVDAAAAGVQAVSTFLTVEKVTVWPAAPPDCRGEGDPGEVSFDGFAAWSGTSAAAPRVAGAIAAAIRPGVDAREAAYQVVEASAVTRAVGLGAIVQPARWG